MASIENQVLSILNSVNGLSSKDEEYISSLETWVIPMSNVSLEGRKDANKASMGLTSLHMKGGYISCYGAGKSWPFMWYTGNVKATAYDKVEKVVDRGPTGRTTVIQGEACPFYDLVKPHDGEKLPFNINLPLKGELLSSIFQPMGGESKAELEELEEGLQGVQRMEMAYTVLSHRLLDLVTKYKEVQLQVVIGWSPETYSKCEVTRMQKSSVGQEDRWVYQVPLTEKDVLAVKWVLPTDAAFVPGLSLGQVVNVRSQRVASEQVKAVLQPEEILPKDATVTRWINKNYGKFVESTKLDYTLDSTKEAFFGTFTEAFLTWVNIAEKREKALASLADWSPAGKVSKGRVMAGATPAKVEESKPSVVNLEKEVAAPSKVEESPVKTEEVKQEEPEVEMEVTASSTIRRGGMGSMTRRSSVSTAMSGDFE